jgi:hypothetical protein
MNKETAHYLDLLEARIALLGSLANSLVLAREGVVSLDIDGLERRIHEQEKLCGEIRAVDARIDRIQKECAARLEVSRGTLVSATLEPDTARLHDTLARLQQVQCSVKKLNNEHQALLRRSRRTVGALLNSYHSFALTYSEPRAAQSALEGNL